MLRNCPQTRQIHNNYGACQGWSASKSPSKRQRYIQRRKSQSVLRILGNKIRGKLGRNYHGTFGYVQYRANGRQSFLHDTFQAAIGSRTSGDCTRAGRFEKHQYHCVHGLSLLHGRLPKAYSHSGNFCRSQQTFARTQRVARAWRLPKSYTWGGKSVRLHTLWAVRRRLSATTQNHGFAFRMCGKFGIVFFWSRNNIWW